MEQGEVQSYRTARNQPAEAAGIFSANKDRSLEIASTIATLVPRDGAPYLKATEVVGRIRAIFAYVETSKDGTRRHVLEWMNQLMFVAPGGRSAAHDDYLAQLERLQDEALFVHFGDDIGSSGVLLNVLVIPGQPLVIDYPLLAEPMDAQLLIERCAAALGYETIEQGNVAVDAGSGSAYATSLAAA